MLSENVLEWLLEEENPSVRFYTLTSLLGKSPDDPEVVKARTAIMTQGKVPKIRKPVVFHMLKVQKHRPALSAELFPVLQET